MSLAGKNLRYLRKQKNWTQDAFAEKLGIKRSLVGAYEEERADPRLEVLEQACALFDLSLDELMLSDVSSAGESYLQKRRNLKMGPTSATVQFVPVKAAAGYMTGYADPDFLDELNTFTLPMLSPGEYRAFEIVGDSMLPTPSGSVIVGEKVNSLEDVKSSQPCIVVSKSDGIVYKRVLKNNRSKAKLTLLSDNPDYEPYEVNADNVLEMWKAVYVIQKAGITPRWDMGQLANVVNNLQEQVTSLKKKMN